MGPWSDIEHNFDHQMPTMPTHEKYNLRCFMSTFPGQGQYFVDQATGQYYYQSKDGETMTVVQTGMDDDPAEEAAASTSAVAAVADQVH